MPLPADLLAALDEAWDAAELADEQQATVMVNMLEGLVKVRVIREEGEIRFVVKTKNGGG